MFLTFKNALELKQNWCDIIMQRSHGIYLLDAMNVIALECSASFCSLALSVGGRISSCHEQVNRNHNAVILKYLNSLLTQADITVTNLNAVVYGRGPGSFTGVRIAASVAQAVAFANNIPLHAVSSLAAMAWSAPPNTHVLTLLDARLGELYWSAWRRHDQGIDALVDEAAASPEQVAAWLQEHADIKWLVLGEGGALLQGVWLQWADQNQDFGRLPNACSLIPLMSAGTTGSPEIELPVYLRAEKPWRKE